jgi:hypothetical protein
MAATIGRRGRVGNPGGATRQKFLAERTFERSTLTTTAVLRDPSFAEGPDLDLLTPCGTMHSADRENNNHSGSPNPSDQ